MSRPKEAATATRPKEIRSEGRAPSHDPSSPRRRTWLVTGIIVVCLGIVATVSYLPPHLTGEHNLDGALPAAPPTPITYWPSAATTGVPPGVTLRQSAGLTLRTDNQVVTGLDIAGCVTIHARNVRITRSRIKCSSPAYAIRTMPTVVNLVVEDVEIDGLGRTGVTICCGNYTLRRVNIHGSTDGPRLGTNTTIVDSYVHDLARAPGTHNDALQITGGVGVLVQRNNLSLYNPVTKDPLNACLMIGSETAPEVRNMLVVNNYCNGGNWSIGVRFDLVASNIVFRENKFGRDYRYGVIARPTHPGITWERSNVWFDNGQPVIR